MNVGGIIGTNIGQVSYEVTTYILNSYEYIKMSDLDSMAYTTALSYSQMETLFPLSE